MKNKILVAASLIAAVSVSTILPSLANGPVKQTYAFVGTTTATVVDVPEGIIVDSAYRVPKHYWHVLASAFGDENGLGQNLAGAVIGIPFGVVFGIPYGAIHGLYHAWNTGWEKPFSTDSYIVTEE
jgi:hypothetical protein